MTGAASLALGALLVLSVLVFSALSAMVERPSPIRLRHWSEEAGGGLRRLYERPERWEAFRLLLSSLAQIAPLGLLFRIFGRDPLYRRFDRSASSYWIAREQRRGVERYFQQF